MNIPRLRRYVNEYLPHIGCDSDLTAISHNTNRSLLSSLYHLCAARLPTFDNFLVWVPKD